MPGCAFPPTAATTHRAIVAGQVGLLGNRMGALPGSLNVPGAMIVAPGGDLLVGVGRTGIVRLHAPARAEASDVIAAAAPMPLPVPSKP